MEDMLELISKLSDTHLDAHGSSLLPSLAAPRKVIYFEFDERQAHWHRADELLPQHAQLRMQILLDLYVVGNARCGEQGALQLLRMCDRLFAGFLHRVSRLLALLGWLPCAQHAPLQPLEAALTHVHSHVLSADTRRVLFTLDNNGHDDDSLPDKLHAQLATLDAQQLFSYMFSLLLSLLLPVAEDQWTSFLRTSCVKFNNCLRLAWSEAQFCALVHLLRPPYARLQQYRALLCRSAMFEQELLNAIEHNAFANGLLKEMCYHFLSIKQQSAHC